MVWSAVGGLWKADDTWLQNALEVKVALLWLLDAYTQGPEDRGGKTGSVHELDNFYV